MDSKPIFDEIFQRVSKGNIISPRGSKVIEVENFMYELPPYVKFQNYDVRKLKFNYIKQELLWYLRHNVHDTSIVNFASIWKDLIQPNGTINSNYGAHLFDTVKTNRSSSQFLNVVDILRKDADSRRASMVILTDNHLLCDIDVPCTYSLNFRIRNNKLNMTVHMRSQDAIFGMGNDAPAFSMIHEMVLNMLEADYPELTLGNYTHFADSFHVYERHFELLEKERAFFNQEEIKIALCSLKELIIDDCVNDFDIGLYNKLLSEKRRIIANLLVSEEKMEQNFNKLLLSYERDKAFFEREMEKFFNVRNG